MRSELIKILRFIINTTKIANFVYTPTGDRLAIITSFDLMTDNEIAALANSRNLRMYVESIDILGSASPKHAYGFLKTFEGKAILKRILEQSTFMNSVNDVEEFVDEAVELMNRMSENDPF